MKDTNVVDLIKVTSELHGLTLSFSTSSGKFREVFLEADSTLPREEQVAKLKKAAVIFTDAGLEGVKVTRFNNPPYKSNGKWQAGHPRHGDPLLEISSVWWSEELEEPKKTWKPKGKAKAAPLDHLEVPLLPEEGGE